ncbi:MAG: BolA/IbaG family iron-sulfur metabolism protein [Rickettsiales bacterium]|nr:BolA/IbaG family iron-sulfur metabolism protein [Rickettsiales bacterium]
MPMPAEEITQRIAAALPGATITLRDLAGDNDHWEVTVVAAQFAGLTRVKQHKLVMDAFGSDMGTTLHALSIKTHAA